MPKDYQTVSLKALGMLRMGETIIAEQCTGAGIPIYSADTSEEARNFSNHPKFRHHPGAIIIGARGSIGFPRMPDDPEFAATQTTIVFQPNEKLALARYMMHALCNVDFGSVTAQQAIPMLTVRELGGVHVPLPALFEQRRIAEILDTLDEAIRRTEHIVVKLRQIKQGLLHDLLTRGIDENGELRDPERHPELFNGTRLGKLPRNWQIKPLQEVVSSNQYAIVDGPFGSNLKSIHYRRSGIPVIQSGYVTTGRFLASSYYYVTAALFNAQRRSRVDPGDIVMAKIGAQAGRCAVLPDDHPVGILAGNCLKITCDEDELMSQFLLAYLHRLYEVGGMRGLRAETAQPAISLSRLRRLLVPCPAPREQSSMLQSIGEVEARQQKEEEDLAKLSCLKKGLMEDLLTGRVRVTKLEAAA
jgi:restriction endonuclease S subunit